ncbi:MAG: hypothetical protein KatS3mg118_0613 [Paracoccaceae bacterium]|nr:MAG: hypothetical protein KatS3mg118_0613 [Paracoccaceae bacterium]
MSVEPAERDDAVLAGEYALGLLEGEERAAFEARLAREPELRRMVRDWQEAFAGLADEVAPVPPPARLRGAIEARLFGRRPAGWLSRRRLIVAGGGAALAAAAALALALRFGLLAPPPTIEARIASEDGALQVAARIRPAGEAGAELVAELLRGAAAPGRAMELWLIPEGAPAPVSLGVLPQTGTLRRAIAPALARQLAGATLAISDEPPGGSPTGQPTGAVLATGRIPPGPG